MSQTAQQPRSSYDWLQPQEGVLDREEMEIRGPEAAVLFSQAPQAGLFPRAMALPEDRELKAGKRSAVFGQWKKDGSSGESVHGHPQIRVPLLCSGADHRGLDR